MKKTLSLILFIIIFQTGFGGTSGSVQAQSSPWPMFRHDLKHTARTGYTGPTTPDLAWTYQTNDGIVSSVTIGEDGTLYFGSGWYFFGAADSNFYALNPDGSLKWKYTARNGIFSSPALAPDGSLYFSCIDGFLYGLEDSVTYGKLKWTTYLEYFFALSSPAVGSDGTVYVGSPSFEFYAVNPLDGSIKWQQHVGWCIISSPAIIEDGTIYVGSKDHNLYAMDPVLEGARWQFPTGVFYDGHLVDASPAVGQDGTIYVGSDQYGAAGHGQAPTQIDTSFWAINPDGSLKWAFETGTGVESSPAIGLDGTLYFGCFDSSLYAVRDNGTYGELLWKFKTDGVIDGSPSIDGDGIIYFGSRDSSLYALYPDGTLKWEFEAGGGIESSPTIDGNGHVIFGAFDGKLYCLGNGTPDVGVISIDIPLEVSANQIYIPIATVNNYRIDPQDMEVACYIDTNGVIIYADTITALGLPDGQSLVQFGQWPVGPDSGIVYQVTVKTILVSDENADNDQLVGQIESTGQGYICGDANGDGSVNLGDAGFIVNYIFYDGAAPNPLAAGDTNNDGSANLGDSGYLINYIFYDGPAPCN